MSPKKMAYDRVIARAKEAGIFDKIIGDYTIVPPSSDVKAEIMVLKMEHYVGAFYLLFLCLGVSIIVFLVEIFCSSSHNNSKLKQRNYRHKTTIRKAWHI